MSHTYNDGSPSVNASGDQYPTFDNKQKQQSAMPAELTSIACRQIPGLPCQHREHYDGNGQHGLCDQGVSSSCGRAPGHDQAGHVWSYPAPCPSGQLPGSI